MEIRILIKAKEKEIYHRFYLKQILVLITGKSLHSIRVFSNYLLDSLELCYYYFVSVTRLLLEAYRKKRKYILIHI